MAARWEEFAGGKPRAPRYPVRLPIRYRPPGASDWRPGTTVNVSRSGLLFQTEQAPPPAKELELRLSLFGKAEIVCQVRIVRHADSPALHPIVAAAIDHYIFRRPFDQGGET